MFSSLDNKKQDQVDAFCFTYSSWLCHELEKNVLLHVKD